MARRYWRRALDHGDVAVDATCGNGRDARTLAGMVGPDGRLYAVDVQQCAVDATRALLADALGADEAAARCVVQCGSHASLEWLFAPAPAPPRNIGVVAYNLGRSAYMRTQA